MIDIFTIAYIANEFYVQQTFAQAVSRSLKLSPVRYDDVIQSIGFNDASVAFEECPLFFSLCRKKERRGRGSSSKRKEMGRFLSGFEILVLHTAARTRPLSSLARSFRCTTV